jgi:hypothetical protein
MPKEEKKKGKRMTKEEKKTQLRFGIGTHVLCKRSEKRATQFHADEWVEGRVVEHWAKCGISSEVPYRVQSVSSHGAETLCRYQRIQTPIYSSPMMIQKSKYRN